MKIKNLYHVAVAVAFTGILFSCQKSNNSDNGNSNTDLQTQSDDQTRVADENDAIANDFNTTMTTNFQLLGASTNPGVQHGVIAQGGPNDTLKSYICDATVVADTTSSPRTVTITYNGSNCNLTRTRTGKVVISIPAGVQWRNPGAVITVSIQNLKITRLFDNKSITLNGTHTYTNVSGGSLLNLPNITSITHTVTSDDMTITFDNGAQRAWHFARKRVYTEANNIITVTLTGMHTDGATTGISEWGTNRFGNTFETVISQPLTVSNACNTSIFQLTGGAVTIVRPAVTLNVTFGLDSSGNPSGCPVGSAVYYFKLVFTGAAGKSYTFILPY
jgi:hypothetical protein